MTFPTRRGFGRGAAAVLMTPARAGAPLDVVSLAAAVRAAEAGSGGRLGVALADIESGQRFAWRGDERFPFASTFKFLLTAAVLAAAAEGRVRLDRPMAVGAADMVPHAPVTCRHVGGTLTVAALCDATMTWSDNPAANLLLPLVGGPAGLTGFARRIGDDSFRLDRFETALSEGAPDDPRDTTTPAAMLADMKRLLFGPVLGADDRARLAAWLAGCRTGDNKIRAGLPGDWRCGDRSGGGGHGTNNDIAVLWPPGRQPILVTAYLTGTTAPLGVRDAALAAVGRAVVAAIR